MSEHEVEFEVKTPEQKALIDLIHKAQWNVNYHRKELNAAIHQLAALEKALYGANHETTEEP